MGRGDATQNLSRPKKGGKKVKTRIVGIVAVWCITIILSAWSVVALRAQQQTEVNPQDTINRAVANYATQLERENLQLQAAVSLLREEIASEKTIAGLDSFCVKYNIPVKRVSGKAQKKEKQDGG